MKKPLSLVLALVILIGMLPLNILATERTDETQATETTEITEVAESIEITKEEVLAFTAVSEHDVDTDRLYNTITVNKGQLASSYDGSIIESDIYGYVVNYPLKKGHVLSISNTDYVFSVRKWVDGNFFTMLKQATTDSFTATEDMTVAMLIRKPDKSALTEEELNNIVIYDSQYGMISVDGYAHRFTVESETIDGSNVTTRALLILPKNYEETGEKTPIILHAHGRTGFISESQWCGNKETHIQLIANYLNAGYAVFDVDNTEMDTSAADLGCPQLVSSYLEAYEYIQQHFNVEEQFSIHSRSFGTFTALRVMREMPELVKCAVMTGPWVSMESVYSYSAYRKDIAVKFGFSDNTGSTYEAEKLVGYDPYTDIDAGDYWLPPTFWMMAENDANAANMHPAAETFISKLNDLGCVTQKEIYDTDHTGVCSLNSAEMTADALAFLEKYQETHTHSYTSAVTEPTCTEQGYTTHTCSCGDSYVDTYVDTLGHSYGDWYETAVPTCAADGEQRRDCQRCTAHETRTVSCGHAPEYSWDVDGDNVLEILAIGNSFSIDALQYVYQIAQDLGIENVVIGNLYISGCTLKRHAANAAGDLANYTYYYNDSGTWTTASEYSISAALTSRSWDYISMQQSSSQSGIESSYNDDLTDLIAYVKDLTSSADNQNRNPCAKLVWHMTWAYQQDSTNSAFSNYGSDQMTMYNAIVSAVQSRIDTNTDIDIIIPCGTAVQNARTSLVGDTLTRDGYHMSRSYGQYLTGLMFVKSITGLGIDSIAYVPEDVCELYRRIAVESVNNACAVPFAVTQSGYSLDNYILLQPELYKGAFWSPVSAGRYNVLIYDASVSDRYFATVRFTREELPIGSIIILEDGWRYRPDGWVTDELQTGPRESTTGAPYVIVTEEWWGDYTIRSFNIYQSGTPSLTDVTEEEVRAAFRIYVPAESHTHIYHSAVTAPTCTDQGYTTHTCSCGDSYADSYVDATGHSYESGICTVCVAEHPNMANFEGKVISIMGDSISTFAGYIPVADGFNREHLARYPQDNLLTDVNETWWMQLITELGAKLGINDSWRGATVSGASPVTSGDTGENAAMSNLIRIQNLGSNGTPDVILLYGGTNDLAHVEKIGTFDSDTVPATVDLTTTKWDNLADGYVHTLLRMRHYYPDAVIVTMLPTYTASYYSDEKLAQANEVLAQICKHYEIAYVDLRDSGVTAEYLPDGIHPGAEGMDMITQAVLNGLLAQCEMEPGENVVHSVSHNLTNATASLGHYKGISTGNAFTETLSGEELTVKVTMGGVDITESCYADGMISIAEVTGDLVITAEGTFLGSRLQQLAERYWEMDLWPVLEHDEEYYTSTGWGVHSTGKVRSVTIPVTADHIIWASSFGASGENGGPVDGIRVTFFTDSGVLVSMTADEVYTEFSEKGYLAVPEGASVVCVPMWTEESGELYILPLAEVAAPESFHYALDEENSTVILTEYTGSETAVTVDRKYMVDGRLYAAVLDASSVFRGNESITSVKIQAGVDFRNNSMAYLFSGCKKLTTVDMTGVDTSEITSMRYLFDWCSKLSSIIGYESWDTGAVQDINKMFNRTTSLTTVDLSAWDLSQVINSGWCFQMCYATQILLPDSLKTMSAGFLNHATKYAGTSFTIPAGVQKIGYAHTIYDFATNDFMEFRVAEGNEHYVAIDGILYSADGTEMLAIPRNKPFENNTYEIPEGVTFLGELSFSRNYNIHKLVLPNSFIVENVSLYDEDYIVFEDTGNLNSGTNLSIAIYCYTGITEYAVKEDNPNYTAVDGIIYSKDMTEVVAIPARYAQPIVIPEGVTTWNTEAMWADLAGNSNLPSLLANCAGVSIPASLTAIDEAQLDMLNLLAEQQDFTITVDGKNPVYCVDGDGKLMTHSFTSTVTEPTCTERGYTTHTCGCGYSYVDSYVDATAHSHSRYGSDEKSHWSICVCGEIIDGTTSSHAYIDEICICGATHIKVIVVSEDISWTVSVQTVTVASDMPCRIGYWDEEAQTYIAITAIENEDGSYSFTAPDDAEEVLIVITGEINGDGRMTATDVAGLNAHILGKKLLTAEAMFAADVNGDGLLDESDKTVLSKAILGKEPLAWEVV